MANNPKISIVIPSFNQGKYLEESIDSVLDQKYPNYELFVMDGGSTDNSVEIIKRYGSRITGWESRKDNGQSDAIIRGFKRCTGELIAWLNSDDVYFPQAFWRLADSYNVCKEASIYTGGVAIGGDNNSGIVKCSYPPMQQIWFKRYGIFYVGQMATFFNRSVYEKTEGIDVNLTQIMDRDVLYKMVNANNRICRIPGMVGFIRFHDDAKSSKKYPQHIVNRKEEIAEFYRRNGIRSSVYEGLTLVHQICRFCTMNYFDSWKLGRRYRGKMMKEIWVEECKNSNMIEKQRN